MNNADLAGWVSPKVGQWIVIVLLGLKFLQLLFSGLQTWFPTSKWISFVKKDLDDLSNNVPSRLKDAVSKAVAPALFFLALASYTSSCATVQKAGTALSQCEQPQIASQVSGLIGTIGAILAVPGDWETALEAYVAKDGLPVVACAVNHFANPGTAASAMALSVAPSNLQSQRAQLWLASH